MGIKLIILLALLVGVLYSLHLLVKDYQALAIASRLVGALLKRDVSSQNYTKPAVRWKKILLSDPIQCARYFYCELGARPENDDLRKGFINMLTAETTEENKSAHAIFQEAYNNGKEYPKLCRQKYPLCIFKESLLFDLIGYLLRHPDL